MLLEMHENEIPHVLVSGNCYWDVPQKPNSRKGQLMPTLSYCKYINSHDTYSYLHVSNMFIRGSPSDHNPKVTLMMNP
jgi:hypothetical protein